jgi:hypothetical protein
LSAQKNYSRLGALALGDGDGVVESQTDGLVRVFAALVLEDRLLKTLRKLAGWWSERTEKRGCSNVQE